MARILYGVAGEGRGHAVRALTMVRSLHQRGHEIQVLSFGSGYRFLKAHWPHTLPIPGMRWHYRGRRVSYFSSMVGALPVIARVLSGLSLQQVEEQVRHWDPDLVVSDFEPHSARIAHRLDRPLVSLDNQHKVTCAELETDGGSRLGLWLGQWMVQAYVPWPDLVVVSTFFPLVARRPDPRWVLTGPILREAVIQAQPIVGEHVLVYSRNGYLYEIARGLKRLGAPARIYGTGHTGRDGPLEYRPIDERAFLDDLISARAVIATAGNQLLSEALYLGKPVLAIPEDLEQTINAYYVERLHFGRQLRPEQVYDRRIAEFLDAAPRFTRALRHRIQPGNAPALAAIESMI